MTDIGNVCSCVMCSYYACLTVSLMFRTAPACQPLRLCVMRTTVTTSCYGFLVGAMITAQLLNLRVVNGMEYTGVGVPLIYMACWAARTDGTVPLQWCLR